MVLTFREMTTRFPASGPAAPRSAKHGFLPPLRNCPSHGGHREMLGANHAHLGHALLMVLLPPPPDGPPPDFSSPWCAVRSVHHPWSMGPNLQQPQWQHQERQQWQQQQQVCAK